jgi:mono/diheme cytochrome c family protein
MFPRPLILLVLSAASALADPIHFGRQIRPILSENCFFCHGPDEAKREAGLRLDDETAAKSDNDGTIAIVPGHPEKSALLQRILSTDPDEVMPPPKLHKVIPPAQIALLTEWIKQSAPWGKHWSYEPVKKPSPPSTTPHPVDAFLLTRLTQEKLTFSPEAPPPRPRPHRPPSHPRRIRPPPPPHHHRLPRRRRPLPRQARLR